MKPEEICMPDYSHCITGVSSAVLKKFCPGWGKDYHKELYEKLEGYTKIVLFVCDAMGSFLIDGVLGKDCFLNSKKIDDVSSVFPSATVAAINSIRSAMPPAAHCRLGWTMFHPLIRKNVDVFSNRIHGTHLKIGRRNRAEKEFAYDSVMKLIGMSNTPVYTLAPLPEADIFCKDIKEPLHKYEVLIRPSKCLYLR